MSLTPRRDNGRPDPRPRRRSGKPNYEEFSDVPDQTMAELAGAPDGEHGLVFTTPALDEVRPPERRAERHGEVQARQPAANLTVGWPTWHPTDLSPG